MDRKGLLLPETESFLANVFWDFIEPRKPKWIPKWITMQGLLVFIRTVDNLILHKMPENLKKIFIPFIDAAMAGKVEEVRRLSTDVIVSFVDWKGVSKDNQLYVYDSVTRLVVSLTLAFVDKYENKQAA